MVSSSLACVWHRIDSGSHGILFSSHEKAAGFVFLLHRGFISSAFAHGLMFCSMLDSGIKSCKLDNGIEQCQDSSRRIRFYWSWYGHWVDEMLSMSGEVIHKGDSSSVTVSGSQCSYILFIDLVLILVPMWFEFSHFNLFFSSVLYYRRNESVAS